MNHKILRRNTVLLDFHQAQNFPQIDEVQDIIKTQLPATIDNILSIEPDSYKRQIFITTISQFITERFVTHCNGHVNYVQNGTQYRIPVTVLEDDLITVSVATIPYACPNEHVKVFFSQYGDVARIVQLNHAAIVGSQCIAAVD